MLQSRRGFLVGFGSLLTAAFIKDARSFIRTNGQPLLARPKQVAQTMYWYPHGDSYLLSLGEYIDGMGNQKSPGLRRRVWGATIGATRDCKVEGFKTCQEAASVQANRAWLPPLLWSPWPRPQTNPSCVERIRSGNTRSKSCTRCVRFCWLRCRRSAPRTRKG